MRHPCLGGEYHLDYRVDCADSLRRQIYWQPSRMLLAEERLQRLFQHFRVADIYNLSSIETAQ